MIKSKLSLLVVAGILAAFCTTSVEAAEKDRIGYVNLSLVFDAYEKTKQFDKDLEREAEGKRNERTSIVNEVKRLRDEIELSSSDKRAQKQSQINDKLKELQTFDRDARENLRRKRDAMLREIIKEIDVIVKEYGDQEGYAYIFNDRVLLYKDENNDLSQMIIKRLNASNRTLRTPDEKNA